MLDLRLPRGVMARESFGPAPLLRELLLGVTSGEDSDPKDTAEVRLSALGLVRGRALRFSRTKFEDFVAQCLT